MSRFRAAIFDMDGLLIDSEPLWQEAEIHCFAPLGVPITRDICRATAGQRLDEVIALWHRRFGWEGPDQAEMVQRVLAEVTRLMLPMAKPCPVSIRSCISFAIMASSWLLLPPRRRR